MCTRSTKHHFEDNKATVDITTPTPANPTPTPAPTPVPIAPTPTGKYDPSKPFVVPSAYEASVEFEIPYINLVEPILVHVDQNKGKQRASYYSGADVYIFDNGKTTPKDQNTTSYTIVPVFDALQCLGIIGTGSLVDFFPIMDKFVWAGADKKTKVLGVDCYEWVYTFDNVTTTTNDNATSTSVQPDANGYAGVYTFYVSVKDGTPVQFHAVGHNVVIGGSHPDIYNMNYKQVIVLDEVDDSMFIPPFGMTCSSSFVSAGPKGEKLMTAGGVELQPHHLNNPMHDIEMLFPQGGDRRDTKFNAYLQEHGKQYATAKELSDRKQIFHSALRYINVRNRQNRGYWLSANHMADWTEDEKAALRGYRTDPQLVKLRSGENKIVTEDDPVNFGNICGVHEIKPNFSLPAEVDWRGADMGGLQKGAGLVLPPKDQGTCGSCWTYGTTGAIEAAMAKKMQTDKNDPSIQPIPLSQQSINDCTWSVGNQACNGGTDYLAYAWLLSFNKGQVASAESYGAYLGQDGFCHFNLDNPGIQNLNPRNGQKVVAGAIIKGCTHVTPYWNSTSPDAPPVDSSFKYFNDALARVGPISVAIDATVPDFYYYTGGYYYDEKCSATALDHIVLAVGYTTMNGQKYTILRNSWSDHWGEKGYIKMSQKVRLC